MNRVSNIVAQRLRDRDTLTYDNMMMKEIGKLTNNELIEIGTLGMTKYNLISRLYYILDKVDNIDDSARLDKNTPIRHDVNAIYDIINDTVKILRQEID